MHAGVRGIRRSAITSSLSGLVLAGTVLGVIAALLAPPLPAFAGASRSLTFSYTGGEQHFTVPARVTSVHIVAVGADGGTGIDPGGSGAAATADLAVKPGQQLYVEVGGAGQDGSAGTLNALGGFNGGGPSGGANYLGGGGGGASDVRTGKRAAPGTLDGRVVVAGGGGGGGGGSTSGSNVNGGDAGHGGGGVFVSPGTGGGGGAAHGTTPGTGGAGGYGGTPGTADTGGTGGSDNTEYANCGSGGGGGGGLAGGGGGGSGGGDGECLTHWDGGGGGGGSSGFGAHTSHQSVQVDATGTARVTISYRLPLPITTITHFRVIARTGAAKISFTATGAVTKFQCELVKKHHLARYTTCRSPKVYNRLSKGSYTFKVRAVGPGGTDKTPVVRHFESRR